MKENISTKLIKCKLEQDFNHVGRKVITILVKIPNVSAVVLSVGTVLLQLGQVFWKCTAGIVQMLK